VSQSRLLPSWLPLARCTVVCEMNRCDMSAAFDRNDGRCSYHGKVADGLFGDQPRAAGTRSYTKYPWAEWLDGDEHVLSLSGTYGNLAKGAQVATRRRGLAVTLWRTYEGEVHIQATRAA